MSLTRPVGIPRQPALDGLRALAVTGVLLYHGGVSWAGGGFLGVDLFFVISGFLITTLLLDEHRRTGRLDLAAFWAARARRLLPALAVLLVTLLWLLPLCGVRWGDRVRGDAWATVGYVSNWWFIAQGDSYADAATGPSPLLHTWSLAIEEQWYLVLPLFLVLALRVRRSARFVAACLVLATAVSVGLAWWLHPAGGDPSRAYFGTDTRVQALLVGAVAAVLVGRAAGRSDAGALAGGPRWVAVPGAAGLLVLAAVARPEADWLYTGGLLAVALACALLVVGVAAGTPGRGPLQALLSARPLVALGLISYGVYLWHWPVFLVLDVDRTGLSGAGLFAARVAATLAVAATSYVLVERPVRRRTWPRRPVTPRWVPVAGVMGLVLAALVFPAGWASPSTLDRLASLAEQQRLLHSTGVTPPLRSPGRRPGAEERSEPIRTVALVGDSQALSLFAAVGDRPGHGVTLTVVTRFGCGVVPYVATVDGVALEPQQPLCRAWPREREPEIARSDADLAVLFAGGWEQYDRLVDGRAVSFRDPEWLRLTTDAYATVLHEMARHVPHLAVLLNHCHGAPTEPLPVTTLYQWGRYAPVVNSEARVAATNQAIRAAAATLPDVQVLDVNALLCQGGYHASLDGVTLRTDGLHWTTGGGRMVWQWMAPRILGE